MKTHSLVGMVCLLFCFSGSAISRAQLPPQAEFGGITYPAKGNIQLDEGTLDMWVISQFDTDTPPHKTEGGRNWRAAFFNLVFSDDKASFIIHYLSWAQCFAMVGYCKPPQPYVIVGPPHWKAGEVHHIVFTWSGSMRSVFIDGNSEWVGGKGPLTSKNVDVQADIRGNLAAGLIQIGGNSSHITVDEIQIRRLALTPEEIIKAKDAPLAVDANTLLLDHCDGGPPEVMQGEKPAEILSGKYEIVDGKFGKAIKLWKEKK
jgi:hypothetical protein